MSRSSRGWPSRPTTVPRRRWGCSAARPSRSGCRRPARRSRGVGAQAGLQGRPSADVDPTETMSLAAVRCGRGSRCESPTRRVWQTCSSGSVRTTSRPSLARLPTTTATCSSNWTRPILSTSALRPRAFGCTLPFATAATRRSSREGSRSQRTPRPERDGHGTTRAHQRTVQSCTARANRPTTTPLHRSRACDSRSSRGVRNLVGRIPKVTHFAPKVSHCRRLAVEQEDLTSVIGIEPWKRRWRFRALAAACRHRGLS
mmetsp:Transcript_4457/g.13577  ORF Transcript_4457/g.13577 Transcript_4457/m.13577 type:complete len:258 (-) Transcript_4457:161-934(-)